MKKIFILACATLMFGSLKAQDDCMAFFPTNQGALLISKTYAPNNNLLRTMTYKVMNTANNVAGEDVKLGFTMTDRVGKAIDTGDINARCENGTFYLTMHNQTICPEIMEILSQETELVGDFLDYPNTFVSLPGENAFQMADGEYTISSKKDKKDRTHVRVYNRKHEKNEMVTTPAGDFHASKVKFDFEVNQNNKKTKYNGVEWYAEGAGIVRAETYDSNGDLVNYTLLTTLMK